MTGDYIPPYRRLYLTPDAPPEGRFCRQLQIPDDPTWIGLVDGVLSQLAEAENWRGYGSLTPEETAELFLAMLLESWALEGCGTMDAVPTPFWDEAGDVDDEVPPDEQVWYGEVTDPEAPAPELDFVENIGIWAITGFIAYSGNIGAAIAFHTIAPSFVLAWRAGDVGEIFRIVVDAAEAGTVDTTGLAGEVIRTPINADPSLSGHDIMLIKVS